MATADRMFYAGLDLPVQWWILYRGNCSSLSISTKVYLYQSPKVCSALRYRNIDPLAGRHEYTGGFTHEVSATDTWCMLVSSCLQCRGASAIWFVNHWCHLTSSTRISVWPCCTPGPWSSLPAHDALRPTKAESKWPAGEDRRVAFATFGSTKFRRMPTLYCYLRCAWRSEISKGHGAAQRFTPSTWRRWWRWRM